MDDDTQVNTFLWLKSPSRRNFPPEPRKVRTALVCFRSAQHQDTKDCACSARRLLFGGIDDCRCSAHPIRGHPSNFLYNKKLAQVLTHLRLRGSPPGKLTVRP